MDFRSDYEKSICWHALEVIIETQSEAVAVDISKQRASMVNVSDGGSIDMIDVNANQGDTGLINIVALLMRTQLASIIIF